MKIIGILSDLILPSSPLGEKGLQCASGAIIGGTISKSWNSTAVNVLAGGFMSMLSNFGHSPRKNLGAAVTFSAITHAVDYYLPIHKLFATAVGMAAASALLRLPAARNIFTISIISTVLTYSPQIMEHFFSIPPPVVYFVARSIAMAVGGIGGFFMGGSIARALLHEGDSFWFDRTDAMTNDAKYLMYNVGTVLAACAVIAAVDDSIDAYVSVVKSISALGAVIHIGYHYLDTRNRAH